MKAAIIEKPFVLTVKDIPEAPMGEYDMRCKMLYGATCSGTDMHLINNTFPWPVNYPTVLGHESIGQVVDVGTRVRNFKVGDVITRVGTLPVGEYDVNWGGFAEYGIARDHIAMKDDGLPTAEWYGNRVNQLLPHEFDPAAATMIITWRETYSYLTRMGFAPGNSLLVIGSGGNGLSFANHAANLGASKVAMIGSIARSEVAKNVGVNNFVDYHQPTQLEELNAEYPQGFDYILDVVGKKGQLDSALKFLRPGGSVSLYGMDDFGDCLLNPTHARGSFSYASYGYDEAEVHQQVLEYMQAGKLDAGNWLNLATPYALDDINEAFAAVKNRSLVKALVKL